MKGGEPPFGIASFECALSVQLHHIVLELLVPLSHLMATMTVVDTDENSTREILDSLSIQEVLHLLQVGKALCVTLAVLDVEKGDPICEDARCADKDVIPVETTCTVIADKGQHLALLTSTVMGNILTYFKIIVNVKTTIFAKG